MADSGGKTHFHVGRTPRLRPTDVDLACLVLGFLAIKKAIHPHLSHYDLLELESLIAPLESEKLYKLIKKLIDEDAVTFIGGDFNDYQATANALNISLIGVKFVYENKKTIIESYKKYCPDLYDDVVEFYVFLENPALSSILTNSETQLQTHNSVDEIPASDRSVPLDHNSGPYKNSIEALERIIEEFKNDHKLDNELGPEKGALLATLEAGRKLLDDTAIKLDIAVALLLEPLKILIQRYDQAIVGATVTVLATSARDLISKLLGLG